VFWPKELPAEVDEPASDLDEAFVENGVGVPALQPKMLEDVVRLEIFTRVE
jgi:hypothetical protein